MVLPGSVHSRYSAYQRVCRLPRYDAALDPYSGCHRAHPIQVKTGANYNVEFTFEVDFERLCDTFIADPDPDPNPGLDLEVGTETSTHTPGLLVRFATISHFESTFMVLCSSRHTYSLTPSPFGNFSLLMLFKSRIG